MRSARVVIKQSVLLKDEKFIARIKVYAVARSLKFPDGYKVSCSLVERETGLLCVLLDNHQPFGYHLHTKLPTDKKFRTLLDVKNYSEAIILFFKEVRKLLNEN